MSKSKVNVSLDEVNTAFVAKWLTEEGKEKIGEAGCHTVDLIAELFFELLEDLGCKEDAKALYEFYENGEEEEEEEESRSLHGW